jgi:hypothetical protein
MSLLPSTLSVMMVMLLASASSHLAQDAAFSSAHWVHQQQAFSQAEFCLQQLAKNLAANSEAVLNRDAIADWTVEKFNTHAMAELSDIPPTIFRITAIGHAAQVHVRLQADYAVDPCDDDADADCVPRIRRLAWRRLEP